MGQNDIEYIKRSIRRTHKFYTKERTDGTATLFEIASYFNILIDREREDDYKIEKIDYDCPSIVIVDTKYNTSYEGKFTEDADLLNYSGCVTRFISTKVKNKNANIEALYYIGENNPIITKITFIKEKYELIIEKEMPNSIHFFINDGEKFTVRYNKNILENDNMYNQPLLTKVFRHSFNGQKLGTKAFERVFTYGLSNKIKTNDSQDKYFFYKNNDIIFGINNFKQRDICNYLRGICLENTKDTDVENYFPLNLRVEDYPFIKDSQTNSAIVFRGGTGEGNHHTMEIYKNNQSIYIKYFWEKRTFKPEFRRKILVNEEFNLPVFSEGKITSEELKEIMVTIQKRFGKDSFIAIICENIETFRNKMEFRNGRLEEEFDPLSPKLLINTPVEDIYKLISSNKESYFNLIREQFENATNVVYAKEIGHKKVLVLQDCLNSK